MKDIVFVTGNPEKAANFAKHIGMEIVHQPVELDEIQTLDADELVEHKARQAYEKIGHPVLVEDVSFVYEALGELPGPFVKFFIIADDSTEMLCRILDGFTNRRAEARCVYAYFDGSILKIFHGMLAGNVASHPQGKGGYGFDQVFCPDGFGGHTAAELDEAEYDRYYSTIKPFADVRAFLKTL